MIRVFRLKKRYILFLFLFLTTGFYINRIVTDSLENRSVSALSWSVANKVIVVDPGHGGIDPGSKGSNGVIEKEVALEVARKLATILGQAGAMVLMTRETDIDLSEPDGGELISRKRQDLSKRVALANNHKADSFISIHVNSYKSGRGVHGAQTFYQPGSEEGGSLAKSIQSEMVRLLKNTDRKAKDVDYYTTRNANMPAVIVEIGFISNPKEEKLMCDTDYQAKLAYAIYSGIIKYFAGSVTATNSSANKEKMIETFMHNEGRVYGAP